MRRSAFGRDTGLQVRMLITLFLLGVIYAALVGALVASGKGVGVIAFAAAALFVLQVFTSDKIALAAAGARAVSPAEAPELHAMVERLCVQANLPKPRIAVAQTRMPNAFAMGRSQKAATVCVTTGLLDLLEPAELEGVLGHELTHIINRDVMLMTAASFFASIAAMITQFGFFFGGGGGWGGNNRNNNDAGFALVLMVSVGVYVVSFFLMLALSRYREYAADRGSAVLTGRPSALASALLKISGTMQRVPRQDLRVAEGLNAFFIIPARAKDSLSNIFSDHPPTEQRIARLQRLEEQLQGTAGRAA